MMSQINGHQERLIHDVWGERCLECDCTHKPKVHLYHIKSEEIAVLNCSSCDFTIVVVEIEKLSDTSIADEIKKRQDSLVATHQSFP